MPILLKFFQKIAEDGTLPNSFYDSTITLIPKQDKDNTKNENYRPIPLINIDGKLSTKFYQTEFSNTSQSSYTKIHLSLFQGCNDSSVYANQLM